MKLLFLISCFIALYCSSQDTIPVSVLNANEQAIFNLKSEFEEKKQVSISSLSSLYENESPGIVNIITSEEILERNYNDLLEIFQDIPGFTISTDVQNGIGISSHGIWCGEAKILVMIDGVIVNELAYGSFIIGNRIPVSCIERIEILHGAGSTLYGGFAGMGVINIITKNHETTFGNSLTFKSGVSNNNLADSRFTFTNNNKLLNGVNTSFAGSLAVGAISNEVYGLNDSSIVNYNDSSKTFNSFMKIGLNYRNINFQVLYDYYTFRASHEPYTSILQHLSNIVSGSKEFKFGKISSNFILINQIPWVFLNAPVSTNLDRLTLRISSDLKLEKKINAKWNLISSISGKVDQLKNLNPKVILNNGKYSMYFLGISQFSDIHYLSKYINVFAGYRFDVYHTFKPLIAGRFGFTKEFSRFHYKLIAGNSYKIPTLENIHTTILAVEPVIPENIRDFQLQIGYKLGNTKLKANAFLTQLNEIIAYSYNDVSGNEFYENQGYLAVTGVSGEVEQKIMDKLNIIIQYSNYSLVNGTAKNYIVDTLDLKKGTVANPQHKIIARINYKTNEQFSFGLNYNFTSLRYANERVNISTEKYELVQYKPIHLLDFNVNFRPKGKFATVCFSVKNMLDQKNIIVYSTMDEYPSILNRGRAYQISIKFQF